MYYKIAEVTLLSHLELPSFHNFACEAGDPDVTLEKIQGLPPEGEDSTSEDIVHRKTRDGWFFHGVNSDRTGLLVSGDYTRLRLLGPAKQRATYEDEWFIRIALECLLILRGYVSLHAACVELKGQAVAFCGASGAGKSTRARAWMKAMGANMVSGDRPLIRADRSEVYGVPWDGKECCFFNVHGPLRAILEVRRSSSVYLRKLTFAQKRRLLLQNCFLPMWDTDTAAVQMMNIVRLASAGEILRSFCGPGEEDAKALQQALELRNELKEAQDMKAKSGFVLRKIVGEYVLIPTGENIGRFKGTVLLNGVSAFIWEKLQSPISRDDLLTAVLDEYQVDKETAAQDLDALLKRLEDYQAIEEL